MAFKIVGADENSDFPSRVETRLGEKFATPADLATTETSAVATANSYTDTAETNAVATANSYTDTAISNIPTGGLVEDPADPGFFI